MIIRGGGMGASSRMDGHHCAIFPANGANTPVEIFESDTPLIVEARELVCDSGGPGQTARRHRPQDGHPGPADDFRTTGADDHCRPGRTFSLSAGRAFLAAVPAPGHSFY